MKWNMHDVIQPFTSGLKNGVYMSDLSEWRKAHPVKGYNDFYQEEWDYLRRYKLYEEVGKDENLFEEPIDYIEFGVASGSSFKWWLEKIKVNLHAFMVLIHLKACLKHLDRLERVQWRIN